MEEGRDINCRNKDGFVPEETPRIILTNWPWEQFWPREALGSHATPVSRRVLWVDVKKDLRLIIKQTSNSQNNHEEADDEDPFGWGGNMDAP